MNDTKTAQPSSGAARIKICGLCREEDIRYANRLKPDYIGFVFAPKSRRYVSLSRAGQLYEALDSSIQTVGVFVNEPLSSLEAFAVSPAVGMIQLHGTEDEAYLASLRTITDKPVIQAFSLQSRRDIGPALSSSADYILLDGKTAGSGAVFDWKLLDGISRPYFLAGGLNKDNILTALDTLCPFAVDVSSGVETNHCKDFSKMEEFIRLVRSRTDPDNHR